MNTDNLSRITLGLIAIGAVSTASVARADGNPSPVQTALAPTMLSGYVDTSMQWNLGTRNANAPKYIFGGAAKSDGFNLNVIKLVLEKDAELSDEWGAGYKVDLLFGPDANAYGTESTGVPADFAVKQAYVDLKAPVANGLEFKVGVWDTILGYEVFETPLNPNFTKSYGYTIEPAAFTGVQCLYNVTELISVTGGVADTLSTTINARANPPRSESYKAYLGDISLAAPSTWGWFSGSTLFGAVVNGFNSFSAATGGAADQTSYYAGSSINTPLKQLTFGLAADYANVGSQSISRSGYAEAYSIYTHYQAMDKLQFNSRIEYFTQSKATATLGLPAKIIAVTETAQYDLWKNVITRVEFRWDHDASDSKSFGGPGGTLDNSYEFIANIIYKF